MVDSETILVAWVGGEVVAKGRPRCTCAGGRPRLYTPAKTRSWEQRAARVFAAAAKRSAGRSERLSVFLEVYRRIPKTGGHVPHDWCAVGPDADNYAKSVLDALQVAGVAPDDRQVVELKVKKMWSDEPGVSVWVRSIGLSPADERADG